MKKLIVTASSLLLGAFSATVLADVTLTVTVDKTKTVFVTEEIDKFKLVTIVVTDSFDLDGAAEAEALTNIDNSGNFAQSTGTTKTASMSGSASDNSGVLGVNQDAGNMVNQGNVVSVALSDSDSAFLDAQDEVDQVNTSNFSSDLVSSRTSTMDTSGNNNSGIVGINQNTGDMNNQTNDAGVAVGMGSYVALSESALGQMNTQNGVFEVRTSATDSISGSISGNAGVVGVNQASGQLNNQASAVNLAATTAVTSIPQLP